MLILLSNVFATLYLGNTFKVLILNKLSQSNVINANEAESIQKQI